MMVRVPDHSRMSMRSRFFLLSFALVGTACFDEPNTGIVDIEIRPSAAVIGVGESRPIEAWGVRRDGSRWNITALVDWDPLRKSVVSTTSDGDSVATFAGHRPGLSTVSASLGDVTSYALIAVTDRPAPSGPLRLDPDAPRYFVDATGRPVYVTGSHTWSSLQDNGTTDPPNAFDFDVYLNTLVDHGHNFMRLWSWEQSSGSAEVAGDYWISPSPYRRTGPGLANDGKPRFDLTRFNDEYFDRLRERVTRAGRHGIFVSIMLFNGWSVEPKGPAVGNPWKGHPFNAANNINGIDGDANGDGAGSEVHRLRAPEILRLQEAYVRRVVDAVNDLDNVLFEISNESSAGSAEWQYHMIRVLREYEAGLPKQHPIGMTVERSGESNDALFRSAADWVAPFRHSSDPLEPNVAYVDKVVISDTDHLCGVCGSVEWVWKSFTRGQNPILMDPFDEAAIGLGALDNTRERSEWVVLRETLGYARVLSELIDLHAVEPMGGVTSSGYALASPWKAGAEYVIFVPDSDRVRVDLTGAPDSLLADWLDPRTGRLYPDSITAGGAWQTFDSPFGAPAVLYLRSPDRNNAVASEPDPGR